MATMNHEARKTFQKEGKWIQKPTKTEIHTCACGTKYLKTRRNQDTCHTCIRIAKSKDRRGR